MSLLILGLNHRTAPVELREKLAVDSSQLPAALTALTNQVAPGVILATCNRLEIYTLIDGSPSSPDPLRRLQQFVADYWGIPLTDLAPFCYSWQEEDCVRHLFRVASGLDSMVVGEWEILGQVRAAFSAASSPDTGSSYVRGPLSRLFHQALRVGRKVHHEASLGGDRRRSVSQVSVQLAHHLLGDLAQRQVLLIGAGSAGQLAGRALVAAGAGNVVVTNRTFSRAEALSGELGGVAAPFEQIPGIMEDSDAVICTTASPDYLLSRKEVKQVMARRSGRPLLLIDIAVPRDVEPEVGTLEGVRLCDIDDLRTDSDSDNVARAPEVIQAETLAAEETAKFLQWWESLDTISAIAGIREYAEEIRRAEVEKTLTRLRSRTATGPEQTDGLDLETLETHLNAMTAALVKKLMHHPTMYIREANDPARQQLVREMFNLDEAGGRHGRR